MPRSFGASTLRLVALGWQLLMAFLIFAASDPPINENVATGLYVITLLPHVVHSGDWYSILYTISNTLLSQP